MINTSTFEEINQPRFSGTSNENKILFYYTDLKKKEKMLKKHSITALSRDQKKIE